MRLIDADKLENVDFSDCIDSMEIMNVIDEQPTAYDVDKVVEQLESELARWQDSGDAYNDEKEKGVATGFRKAIEIVKGGGIDGN